MAASLIRGTLIGRQVHGRGLQRGRIRAVRRQELQAAGRQPVQTPGRPALVPTAEVIREAASPFAVPGMRAGAPVPIAREQDLRPPVLQQDRMRAVQRRELQAAGRQRSHLHGRQVPGRGLQPAAGPMREPVIPGAARLLAANGKMAAAAVPAAAVPIAKEQGPRPTARQRGRIRAVQRQELQAAGLLPEHSQGRQAPGRGLTPVPGPARVAAAAEFRGPVRTRARTKGRHAGQKAAGGVQGEGNSSHRK